MTVPHIVSIYRYPVKGLTPESLNQTHLHVGKTIAHDREWAIEAGTDKFDPDNPKHFPKINFLMLMRDEALAGLQTRYVAETCTLTIGKDGNVLISAALNDPEGRRAMETFFTQFMPKSHGGRPKIVQSADFSFSDLNDQVISIINLASVRVLAQAAGISVNPLRFRANLYIDGIEPWAEMDWVGKTLYQTDGAALLGQKITRRCPAINVNPENAERDCDLNRILMEKFGHPNCGIYMKVTGDGQIAVDDVFQVS